MKKLLKINKINKIKLRDPVNVYCVTVIPNHRIIVNGLLTRQSPNFQQAPKQGTYAKDFRMAFQPPTDSRHFVYSTRSIKLTMEDGLVLEFSRYENIRVNRNGEEMVIQARDLQEGDDFIKVV